jgi:hypothetical protein
MLEKREERLNTLAKINSATKYLEIGIADGANFRKIDVPFKVAVDPKYLFDTEQYSDENTKYLEMTSDEFFSKFALNYEKFDLIYLDGLHTFEQTFRDFCASLRHSHERTIWLIDDTCPVSFASAIPNLRRSRKLCELTGDNRKAWMGDIYKVIFAIHDFFPQFSYATFPDRGQTVIWNETRKDFTCVWNSLEKISRLDYSDFVEFKKNLMNIKKVPDILEAITHSLNGTSHDLVVEKTADIVFA